MTRATTLLALCALACSPAAPPPGSTVDAKLDRRVTIPDATGEADPTSLVFANGQLYATLANLTNYAPAGTSDLGIYDATTLAQVARVPLEKDGVACEQAVALTVSADGLLVACSGRIAFPPERTDDGALVDVSFDGVVRRIVRVGRSPGSVARIGNDVWLGDGEGGGVSHVALDSFDVLATGDQMLELCDTRDTKTGFVADVVAMNGRAFASCFNDDTVQEFDPTSGAKLGAPIATGSGPQHFGLLGDGLFVLDDLGGTMTRILPTPARALVYLGEDGTQGGNDPQGVAGNATVAGVTNSAYGTFVVVALAEKKVVASVDLKPTPDAPTNFPGAVTVSGSAFYVAIPGLDPSRLQVPSELARITVSGE